MTTTLQPLRRNRDYRAWFVGDTTNLLGSSVRAFAMPLLAIDMGGSAAFAGLVGTATLVAEVIGHAPGGGITDRYDRRRLMYLAAGTGIALYGSMLVAWALGTLTPAVLLAVALATGLRSGLFGTVTDSCLRSIVPTDRLGQAMATNEARDASLNIAGAPIGGALYSIGHAVPFAADAVSYVALAISARLIRTDLGAMTDRSERFWHHAAGGARQIWRSAISRCILVMTGVLMIGVRGILVVSVLSLRQGGVHPTVIGLVEACAGVGTLAGAALAARLIDRVRGARLLFGGLILQVLAIVPMLRSDGTIAVAGGLAVMALAMPLSNCVIMGLLAAITPPQLQGRVFAFASIVTLGLQAVAPALAGWGLATLGWGRTIAMFVACMTAGVVIAGTSRCLRRLPRSTEWTTLPEVAAAA